MAKTIKDLYNEKVWEIDFSPEPSFAFAEGFEAGATVALDELKTRLKEYKTNSLGEYFVAWDYINEIINELKG